MNTPPFKFKTMNSPVGVLKLAASERGLAAILWENDDPKRVRLGRFFHDDQDPILNEAERQLAAYFQGARTSFDLPLEFLGTPFQKAVWHELLKIPFGETRTYGDVARAIGRPSGVRAVGAANGRNPISIIAPCHRVIGSDGSLTGYAGGLRAKSILLALEGRKIFQAHAGR